MTIGVGILTTDCGLVLAADTGESYGAGFQKVKNDQKIISAEGQYGCCGIAGAGYSSYMAEIMQKVRASFLSVSREGTENEQFASRFYDKLNPLIVEFHEEKINIFPQHERPGVDLLVGGSYGGSFYLWSAIGNSVSRAEYYGAIGCGSRHAIALLKRLNLPDMDIVLAQVVAAYLVYSSIQNVDECAGETEMLRLLHGKAVDTPRELIEEMESLFILYEGKESLIFPHAIGLTDESIKIDALFGGLRGKFVEIAAKLRALLN
jgi:20S proteasome alpha/beta subunit